MSIQDLIDIGQKAEREGRPRSPAMCPHWSYAVESGFPFRQATNAWLMGWDNARDQRMASRDPSKVKP